MLIAASLAHNSATINSPVETAQIPSTILAAPGLDPEKLIAASAAGDAEAPLAVLLGALISHVAGSLY